MPLKHKSVPEEIIMSRTALLAVLFALTVASGPIAASAPARAESIPPNCTLDPFTGKMTCHIWPTCTLDPFTGKMNCPVPKKATARMSRTF